MNRPSHVGAFQWLFSQPFRHCPSYLPHAGELTLQRSQVMLQLFPYNPSLQSLKHMKKLIFESPALDTI